MPASNCHHFPTCPDDDSCRLYQAKQSWHWEGEAEKSLRNPRRPETQSGGFCLFITIFMMIIAGAPIASLAFVF